MKNKFIAALNELGQSVWYDNLSRDVLKSGELASLISQGVSGLTSNPTIFKQAIADTTNYDADMKSSELASLDTETLCEALMVKDVVAAADLLRPIYDATAAGDGYASLEVSPYLADDSAKTLEAAKRLWAKVDRHNVMIKIPATPQCIPAIRATLEAGINVNVTLIFSRSAYQQVALAYIEALESRVAKGLSIDHISSVASFFVSRVDAIVEKAFDGMVAHGKAQAEERGLFFGKIGVANSKDAYSAFTELFGGQRFAALKAKGAMVQRPLWASTGTKNPAFSPVMYVEELAGRDTVNTMPPATLKALLQGAIIEPRLHSGGVEALSALSKLNVDLNALLEELQVQGVKSFSDSYRDLLASIENKRGKL